MTQTNILADAVIEREAMDAESILDSLSDGQCEVLNLLLAGYETNKDIALKLGIAPSTVAQRISLAAVKLRTKGRGPTKREYERLRKACAFPVYPSQHIPISPVKPQQSPRDWPVRSALTLQDAVPFDRIAPWVDRVERPTSLEAFIEKLNGASLSTIIVSQAVLLSVLAIVVLTILGMFFEFDFLRFVI